MTTAGSLLPSLGGRVLPRFFAQPLFFQSPLRNQAIFLSKPTFSFPTTVIVPVRPNSTHDASSRWSRPHADRPFTVDEPRNLIEKRTSRGTIHSALQFVAFFVIMATIVDFVTSIKRYRKTSAIEFVHQGIKDSFFLLENTYPEVLSSISPLRLAPFATSFSGTETRRWFNYIRREVESNSVPIADFTTPFPISIYRQKRSCDVEYTLIETSLEHIFDRTDPAIAQVRIRLVSDSFGRPRVTKIQVRPVGKIDYSTVFEIIPKQFKQTQPGLKMIAPKSSFDYPTSKDSPIELSPRSAALKEQIDKILVREPDLYDRERIIVDKCLFSWTTRFDDSKL
eukprot:TRINITY_DN893_c0_g1_i1.p1 TRINITY_DN893_c0_g1~~TRINITY_DN893_c0_g1_i1.p1  ORF type:complete len:338 (+),score=53.27 TRINITY_DN893_c0_g1_i1:73-1086(+)